MEKWGWAGDRHRRLRIGVWILCRGILEMRGVMRGSIRVVIRRVGSRCMIVVSERIENHLREGGVRGMSIGLIGFRVRRRLDRWRSRGDDVGFRLGDRRGGREVWDLRVRIDEGFGMSADGV